MLYNKLNTKMNNLKNKVPDASTLIQINQYSTDKNKIWKKKLVKLRIKYLTLVV